MTVAEIFQKANLSPSRTVPWGADVPETSAGVYVIARVDDPEVGCNPCGLPFIAPLPPNLVLDLEYEQQRWLPNEPILYVKTDRPLRKRVREFHRHKCGDTSPHAGGQVLKLLECDLWVYWAPAGTGDDLRLQTGIGSSAVRE